MSNTHTAPESLLNADGEVVVRLADGWTLRSGVADPNEPGAFLSGEYVRLCRPDGSEYVQWDQDEWAADPALVMGAIINAAAGLRPDDLSPTTGDHEEANIEPSDGDASAHPAAMPVYVLSIQNDGQVSATAHRTVAGAEATLFQHVASAWESQMRNHGGPAVMPEDPEEAIETYFDVLDGEETYTIDLTTLLT